jgi:hypothetical protein
MGTDVRRGSLDCWRGLSDLVGDGFGAGATFEELARDISMLSVVECMIC